MMLRHGVSQHEPAFDNPLRRITIENDLPD